MIKYGVSCSLEDLKRPFPIALTGKVDDVSRTAHELGYDGIEISIRNPKMYDAKKMLSVANSYNIEFCGIATGLEYTENGLSLIDDNPSIRRMSIDRLKEHIDLAKQLECMAIVGMIRGHIRDYNKFNDYIGYLSEALVELDEYAGSIKQKLLFEGINRYINNYIVSTKETMVFINSLSLSHTRFHIDTHSMNIEDSNMSKSIYECADMLSYIHMSDSNRGYPGSGNIDFRQIMRPLIDIGYDGYIDIECSPLPDGYEAAKRGITYLKSIENIVRIEKQADEEKAVINITAK